MRDIVSAETQTSYVPTNLSAFTGDLIVAMGLKRFLNKGTDGFFLNIDDPNEFSKIYSMELGRKRGNSYYPVILFSYRIETKAYEVAGSVKALPRKLRHPLGAFFTAGSPAHITREQALIVVYEMLEFLKRHGGR